MQVYKMYRLVGLSRQPRKTQKSITSLLKLATPDLWYTLLHHRCRQMNNVGIFS